jgi:hypothetical protein
LLLSLDEMLVAAGLLMSSTRRFAMTFLIFILGLMR